MFEELPSHRNEPIATCIMKFLVMNSKCGALLRPELHGLFQGLIGKRLLYHNRTSQPASVGLTQACPNYSQLPIFFSVGIALSHVAVYNLLYVLVV